MPTLRPRHDGTVAQDALPGAEPRKKKKTQRFCGQDKVGLIPEESEAQSQKSKTAADSWLKPRITDEDFDDEWYNGIKAAEQSILKLHAGRYHGSGSGPLPKGEYWWTADCRKLRLEETKPIKARAPAPLNADAPGDDGRAISISTCSILGAEADEQLRDILQQLKTTPPGAERDRLLELEQNIRIEQQQITVRLRHLWR